MNRLDREKMKSLLKIIFSILDYSLSEQYLWNILQRLFIGKFLWDFHSHDSCHYVFYSVTPRGDTVLQGGLTSTEPQRTVTASGDNNNK